MADRLTARVLAWLGWPALLRDPAALRADLLAGLTGAIVVLPQGVAFATLAGLPAEYGLYTAMVPCVVAALLGSSRLMVTGPATAVSLTVLGLVSPLALPGSPAYVQLVITLTLMIGLWQLAVGASGLGRLIDRVPHAVIVGFTCGAAVLIVNSQVGSFVGLDWPRGMSAWQTMQRLVEDARRIDGPTLLVSLVTLLACVAARPWNHRVPFMLVGVLAGGVVAAALAASLPERAVRTVQTLPGALPPLSAPSASWQAIEALLLPSIALTLLALAEALAIARVMALRSGERLDGTREVIAQGLANSIGSFFSAYPASGSFNRSGVNAAAGARTPFSAIAAAGFLVLLLAFVASWSRWLPLAAIAAVLLVVAAGLFDRADIVRIVREDRRGTVVMLATFAMVITIPIEWAIFSGIAVHLALSWRPRRRHRGSS